MPFEKTLLLRSFHRFHVVSRSKVSKPFLNSLAILLRAGSHQSTMLASSAEGTRCCRFAWRRRRNQTSLLYEQDRSRCCRVSGSCEQRAHGPLLCRLWRCRRSDVQHLPRRASQKKNLHRGGALTLLSSLVPGTAHYPMKKAQYVDDAEYCWLADHFHMNLSSICWSIWICCNRSQRLRNCRMVGADREPTMSRAHAVPTRPSLTSLLLRTRFGTAAQTSGARSSMLFPSIHLSVQKGVRAPFPICTVVETLNMAWIIRSSLLGKPIHVLDVSVRLNHAQRMRSTYPSVVRSRTPRPPSSVGRETFDQATKHFPPCTASVPFHTKSLVIFSKALMIHGESSTAIDMWIGIAVSVVFANVVLPALLMRPAFHVGNRSATVSSRGCRSTLRSAWIYNGIPRYLQGKFMR